MPCLPPRVSVHSLGMLSRWVCIPLPDPPQVWHFLSPPHSASFAVQALTCLVIFAFDLFLPNFNHVWAQSCLGTNVSGHKRVWAQICLGPNVSGHKRTCLSTYVCGHKRVWGTVVWAQSYGANHVWAQTRWKPYHVIMYDICGSVRLRLSQVHGVIKSLLNINKFFFFHDWQKGITH